MFPFLFSVGVNISWKVDETMPKLCSVESCNNTTYAKNLTFHSFPQNKKMSKLWARTIHIPHSKIPSATYVCSEHFLSSDFIDESRKQLIPTAVPSIKLPMVEETDEETPTTSDSDERLARLQEEYEAQIQMLKDRSDMQMSEIHQEIEKLRDTLGESESQCKKYKKQIKQLIKELDDSHKEADDLEDRIFIYENLSQSDVYFYTGISKDNFQKLVDLLFIHYEKSSTESIHTSSESIPFIDRLLLTLMKLRLNFPQQDIANRFRLKLSTVFNIITTTVDDLFEIFKNNMIDDPMVILPAIQEELFQDNEPNLGFTKLLLVASEVDIEPHQYIHLSLNDLSTSKVKFLITLTLGGIITNISEHYPVTVSDSNLTTSLCRKMCSSSSPELHAPSLSSYRGPPASSSTPTFSMSSSIPCSMSTDPSTALYRIRLYSVMQKFPNQLFPFITKIVKVIACLVNLQLKSE